MQEASRADRHTAVFPSSLRKPQGAKGDGADHFRHAAVHAFGSMLRTFEVGPADAPPELPGM
jgi:hypothetical protein